MKKMKPLKLPTPDLQVEFSAFLATARKAYLIDALSGVVGKLDIRKLDAELAHYVPLDKMRALAAIGLRSELVFPVPMILSENPQLLSYYRLLLGHSQKAFYDSRNGTTPFKCMEDVGSLPKSSTLDILCKEMIRGLCALVDGISIHRISRDLLDDLTLLTLGPQLRGGANVKKGSVSIRVVFDLIRAIVQPGVTSATDKRLVLKNAAGRYVTIKFASDPDIVIRELISKNSYRNIIAIEVKGGTDISNIHNRIGEAEKSHQKARQSGYTECWTIVNVHKLDDAKARRESPATNRFFQLSEIIQPDSVAYADFRNRLVALTGISERHPLRSGSKLIHRGKISSPEK
jgi:hypothetical protein